MPTAPTSSGSGAVSPAQFQAADCAGTPDEVLEQLLAYREIGATRAYLRLLDLRDVEQITLLGDAVLPGVPTAYRYQSERSWNPVRRAEQRARRVPRG